MGRRKNKSNNFHFHNHASNQNEERPKRRFESYVETLNQSKFGACALLIGIGVFTYLVCNDPTGLIMGICGSFGLLYFFEIEQ